MKVNFKFEPHTLESFIGGLSAMDIPKLDIQDLEQATEFIEAYGFDINKASDEKKLWQYYRRAVTYISTELLNEGEEFPEVLSDPNQLKNIAYLLIYASTQDNKANSLQKWACATLKVMHVLVHLDNDLFSLYSSRIQDQILKPIENHIYVDPVQGSFLGKPSQPGSIALNKFDIKPFKSSDSSVTKLLAKPDAVAFTILDKIGVRFITKHLFDSFRVMRFLAKKNLVSHPHNIADQSNNTLYPTNLFLESMDNLTRDKEYELKDLDKMLMAKLEAAEDRAQYKQKLNTFSSKDYRFIKFITRRLVKVDLDEENNKYLNFFYPFEVQIVDYESHLRNLSGSSSHDKYKVRQKEKARLRVFGKEFVKAAENA